MSPVGQEMYRVADAGDVTQKEGLLDARTVDVMLKAADRAKEPLREFLLKKVTTKDRSLFYNLALKLRKPADRSSVGESGTSSC